MFKSVVAIATAVQEESSVVPTSFELQQNYPNPFNPTTTIKFAIPSLGFVRLVVYDEAGREVQTLVNEQLLPGSYRAEFNATTLASGIYYCRLSVEGNRSERSTKTQKMLFIK